MKKNVALLILLLLAILTGCSSSSNVEQLNYLSSNKSHYDIENDAEEFFKDYLEDLVNLELSSEDMIEHYNLGDTIEDLDSKRPISFEIIEIISLVVGDDYDDNDFLKYTLVFTIDGEEQETVGSFKVIEEEGKIYVIFFENEIKHSSIDLHEASDFVRRYIVAYNNKEYSSEDFCNKYFIGLEIYSCIEERDNNHLENMSVATGLFYFDSENHYLAVFKFNEDGYLIDFSEYFLHFDESGEELTVKFTIEYTTDNPINFILNGRAGVLEQISGEIEKQDISQDIYCNYLLESEDCPEVYNELKEKGVKDSELLEYNMYKREDNVYYAIFSIKITFNDDSSKILNYEYYPITNHENSFIFINLDE